MLKLGDQSIAALYLGGAEIKKAYLGETVVFDVSEPPVPTYTVTASIDPSGSGTVTGAGTYQEGEIVTVTAAPEDGYQFTGWQEGGTVVSTNAAYTFTVTGDRALVAVFEVKQASLLPEGYTQLEYIVSKFDSNKKASSIQTGIRLNAQTRITLKVYFESLPTATTTAYTNWANNCLLTYVNVSTNYSNILKIFPYKTGIAFGSLRAAASTTWNTSSVIVEQGSLTIGEHEIVYSYKDNTVSIDGNAPIKPSGQVSAPTTTNARDIIIGATSALYNTTTWYTKYRVLSCKIECDDDSLADENYRADLIPAKRNSDGKAGLFDTINQVFHYNTSLFTQTIEFAAGPEV